MRETAIKETYNHHAFSHHRHHAVISGSFAKPPYYWSYLSHDMRQGNLLVCFSLVFAENRAGLCVA